MPLPQQDQTLLRVLADHARAFAAGVGLDSMYRVDPSSRRRRPLVDDLQERTPGLDPSSAFERLRILGAVCAGSASGGYQLSERAIALVAAGAKDDFVATEQAIAGWLA
jgi:hypothetical protein